MKVEKIDNISLHMNNHPIAKRQVTLPEKIDKVSISSEHEVNEALKVEKPPYFPIGDTQSIFKK
jgi:hypothetical protein